MLVLVCKYLCNKICLEKQPNKQRTSVYLPRPHNSINSHLIRIHNELGTLISTRIPSWTRQSSSSRAEINIRWQIILPIFYYRNKHRPYQEGHSRNGHSSQMAWCRCITLRESSILILRPRDLTSPNQILALVAVMSILLYCYLEYKWIWIIQSSLLKRVDDTGIILDWGKAEKAFL